MSKYKEYWIYHGDGLENDFDHLIEFAALEAERARSAKLIAAIEAFCDGEHSHCGNLFALKQAAEGKADE